MHNKILIVDFGSPHTQLIARKVRELDVYCEIHPFNNLPSLDESIKGIIVAHGPFENFMEDGQLVKLKEIDKNLPILGVGHGAMLLLNKHGIKSHLKENGNESSKTSFTISPHSILFKDKNSIENVSFINFEFSNISEQFITHFTNQRQLVAFENKDKQAYGILAHPEFFMSSNGLDTLKNFVVSVCGCKQDWTPTSFVEESIEILQKQLKDDKVVLGLSGGVDSSVAALLIHRAIGKNLTCIFVDNGLLRRNEFEEVLASYKQLGLNIKAVDAKQQFYNVLKGVSNPEEKRKNIGKTFIDVFDKAAIEVGGAKWLAQGTIYPDVIESVSVKGSSVSVKSHHNVGGLPKHMDLQIVEPLRYLFKDEIRRVGDALQLPYNILHRHPFPGPGLGIRILGEVTPEKVHILQQADGIYIDGLKKHGLYDKIWQAGAILLPIQTVGVTNHERTYEFVVALRAVTSVDGMTAQWYPLPYNFLEEISNRIIHEVVGINRVVYDVSSKPPATIEWE